MNKAMQRRHFLKVLMNGAAAACVLPALMMGHARADKPAPAASIDNGISGETAIEKITKTDAEWKKQLTPEQYDVLRQEGTEQPFTSELLHEKRIGVFACVACSLPLFPSKFKFDSGTGWPSFFDVIPGHIETKSDYKIVVERTEYHCARCGGHQGHLFNDGPQPTGLRYCNDGVALKFVPNEG